MKLKDLMLLALTCTLLVSSCRAEDPTPKPWPLQFHAQSYVNNTAGELSIMDLWYDWVNGRNYNIMQRQLGDKTWNVEWNNGTSYYFDLEHQTCNCVHFPVGVLRPDWLDNAHYLGVRTLDGFTCNVWEKVDFITYYEEVETKRPVAWLFYTGMFQHIVTFEEGAVLSDPYWQAPSYCFTDESECPKPVGSHLTLRSEGQEPWKRWMKSLSSGEF